jgi:hypothetical protein
VRQKLAQLGIGEQDVVAAVNWAHGTGSPEIGAQETQRP